MSRRSLSRVARIPVYALLLSLVALPGLHAAKGHPARAGLGVNHLSQGALAKYFIQHPDAAPTAQLRAHYASVGALRARAAKMGPVASPPFGDRFNADGFGLPQNEESVNVCKTDTSKVLEGTNDYRGLIDPDFNFSGWHYSNNGGSSLTKEGLLPVVDGLASSGDPAIVSDSSCNIYYANLQFTVFDPTTAGTSGIGVYKTDPATLDACPGGTDPSCWPTAKVLVTNAAGRFLDKEWVSVGDTGDGVHVWVTYFDVDCGSDPECSAGFNGGSIKAIRCDADLNNCTSPILISGTDADVQFGDVTVGTDGRTYVSWEEIQGELTGDPQTFIPKLRIADAGSTSFGPTQIIATNTNALPFGGVLHADGFRIATIQRHVVKMVNGSPRVFVVWDTCRHRLASLGETVCEEPKIKLAYSDDDGVSWTTSTISIGGDNYFPTIANDTSNGKIVVAWYTNRFDSFHHAQDVEMVTYDAKTVTLLKRQRVTSHFAETGRPNEPDADPYLGPAFIGDYFEVAAYKGTAYIGYNMNIRSVPFIGEDPAVPQQDNFLTKVSE